MHEAQLHQENCFITLTYRNTGTEPAGQPSDKTRIGRPRKAQSAYRGKTLPSEVSLDYADFQRFLKRTRTRYARTPIRFYVAGEYGEDFQRAHFHACLFGINFEDRTYLAKTERGDTLYTSKILEDLWGLGQCTVNDLTFESAAYAARYCTKKITGPTAEEHYKVVDVSTGEIFNKTPEFSRMSLKPGIGANWISRFHGDVYSHDKMILRGGLESRPPRHYDIVYERINPEHFATIKERRRQQAEAEYERNPTDQTRPRREDRNTVAHAKLNLKRRKL